MGINRRTREVHESLCIRAVTKENLIITHYILSVWCLHLLDRLGNYVIILEEIAQILMITNNIMILMWYQTN